MTVRAALTAICLVLSVAPWCEAETRTGANGAREDAGRARLDRELAKLVSEHALASGLTRELRGYSLSPRLVQLRRYVEPGQKQMKVVCIVSLAVRDPQEALVAEVSGSAAALGGDTHDALDAAAHAAVSRVSTALAKLRGENDDAVARR